MLERLALLDLIQRCVGIRDSVLRRGEACEMLFHCSIPLEERGVTRGVEDG